MLCEYCKETVYNCVIIGGSIMHNACQNALTNLKQGRSNLCVCCNGTTKVTDISRKVEQWVALSPGETAPCAYDDCRGCGHCKEKSIMVNPIVTCTLCQGHGYTQKKYQPITKQVISGYKEI